MWIDNSYELINTDKYRKIVVSDKCVLGKVSRNDYELIASYKTDREAENARKEILDHLKVGHPVMRMPK